MIQVASCEQDLIKTNRKQIENHQSKALLLSMADPEMCHGFQETHENCQHKFNTIYKFCSWQKQQPRTVLCFNEENLVQIRVNSHETSCVEASCRGDWLFAF